VVDQRVRNDAGTLDRGIATSFGPAQQGYAQLLQNQDEEMASVKAAVRMGHSGVGFHRYLDYRPLANAGLEAGND
jgi:hypothetical protein